MTCPERVGKGVITYPCTLPSLHAGPHSSVESTASQRERKRWTDEQEAARYAASGLGQFQEQPQTTAQRYTENPTEVPVSTGRRRLHVDCTYGECFVYDGEAPHRKSAWKECPVALAPPPQPLPTGSWPVPPIQTEIAKPVAAPTKQRDGDQVLPTGDGDCVQDRVIEAMQESKRVGVERYGSTLKTFNGRRGIQDVTEEVRDLFVYLTQIEMEADADREKLIEVVQEAIASESGDRTIATLAVDAIMGWVVGRSSRE